MQSHYYVNRSLLVFASPVLVVVAILGYVAGHGRAASVERTRTALTANVLLTYPVGWQPTAGASEIPGLSIAHPFVMAPDGDAARAGLVTGELAGGEPSLLPMQFVDRMHELPHAEVVYLLDIQAYRYSRLRIPGFDPMLTLYAIPSPGGNPTAVACYASAKLSAYMQTCEQIVDTLSLQSQTQSYDLTPDPRYARQVSASLEAVDVRRAALRREMSLRAALPTIQRLATSLVDGLANAVASLSTLQPPPAAGQAHAALSESLWQARNAYKALAAAAHAGSPSRYAAARTRIYEAEASVDAALKSFALLGYKQT